MDTWFLRSESPPEGWAKYQNNIPPTAATVMEGSAGSGKCEGKYSAELCVWFAEQGN